MVVPSGSITARWSRKFGTCVTVNLLDRKKCYLSFETESLCSGAESSNSGLEKVTELRTTASVLLFVVGDDVVDFAAVTACCSNLLRVRVGGHDSVACDDK